MPLDKRNKSPKAPLKNPHFMERSSQAFQLIYHYSSREFLPNYSKLFYHNDVNSGK